MADRHGNSGADKEFREWLCRSTLRMVERLRDEYEAGDPRALVDALCLVARGGIQMPDWVASEFLRKVEPWQEYEVAELGEALDVAWPKRKKLPAARRRWYARNIAALDVAQIHNDGAPLPREEFLEICLARGMSSDRAEEVAGEHFAELARGWPIGNDLFEVVAELRGLNRRDVADAWACLVAADVPGVRS